MNRWNEYVLLLTLVISPLQFSDAGELTSEAAFQERLNRFYHRIKLHRQNLDKGLSTEKTTAPHQRLLDPRIVKGKLDSKYERYVSYEEIIQDKYKLEAATNISKPTKPQGFVNLDSYLLRYQSTNVAISRALSDGNVWLSPNSVIVLSKPLNMPEGRTLASDGTATIEFDYESSGEQSSLIRILNSQNVAVKDLIVSVKNTQRRYKSGIEVLNSNHVTVEGVELVGISNTRAIIRVNSSHRVTISSNLIHDSFSSIPLRQLTGIEVDETREQGVNSSQLIIKNNLILGIMIDESLFLNTTIRKSGKALLYETDGINLCSTESKNFHLIENNLIVDVGEGIDSFSSYGLYKDNYIERAFSYGMKFIHSSSYNKIIHNTIKYTGLSGIIISQGDRWLTGNNFLLNNDISFVNAFNISEFPEAMGLKQGIGAIKIEGFSQGNLILGTTVSSSVSDELYKGDIVCGWADDARGSANVSIYNRVTSGVFAFEQSNTSCLIIFER